MTSLLFDIASEKGPPAAVSPETDRPVKPVLCGQQGIITFPRGGTSAAAAQPYRGKRLKSDCTRTQKSNGFPHINSGNCMCTQRTLIRRDTGTNTEKERTGRNTPMYFSNVLLSVLDCASFSLCFQRGVSEMLHSRSPSAFLPF